jgi:hypothetical protein
VQFQYGLGAATTPNDICPAEDLLDVPLVHYFQCGSRQIGLEHERVTVVIMQHHVAAVPLEVVKEAISAI